MGAFRSAHAALPPPLPHAHQRSRSESHTPLPRMQVRDASDEVAFTRLLQNIYRRHKNVVPVMAMGVAGERRRCGGWDLARGPRARPTSPRVFSNSLAHNPARKLARSRPPLLNSQTTHPLPHTNTMHAELKRELSSTIGLNDLPDIHQFLDGERTHACNHPRSSEEERGRGGIWRVDWGARARTHTHLHPLSSSSLPPQASTSPASASACSSGSTWPCTSPRRGRTTSVRAAACVRAREGREFKGGVGPR